jgi:hypothetical protein
MKFCQNQALEARVPVNCHPTVSATALLYLGLEAIVNAGAARRRQTASCRRNDSLKRRLERSNLPGGAAFRRTPFIGTRKSAVRKYLRSIDLRGFTSF